MATLGQAPSAPTAHTTDLAPECSCVQRAPPGAGSLERSPHELDQMGQPAPHELDQTGQLPGSLGWPFRGELNVLVTSATVQLWSVQPRALRYACTHTQAHTCTHRCTHTRAHEQIHARLCTLARCVHMSTRMHARMGARAHRHMHTYTHTQTRAQRAGPAPAGDTSAEVTAAPQDGRAGPPLSNAACARGSGGFTTTWGGAVTKRGSRTGLRAFSCLFCLFYRRGSETQDDETACSGR